MSLATLIFAAISLRNKAGNGTVETLAERIARLERELLECLRSRQSCLDQLLALQQRLGPPR